MKKNNIEWNKLVLIILIIALSIVATIVNSRFATLSNLISILKAIAAPGVLAFCMTFVILTGGIDLSAGYGVTLSAIVMGLMFNATSSPWMGLIGAIIAGTLLGIVNGILVAKFKIIPFIATLATMTATKGVLNLLALGNKFFLKHKVLTAVASKAFLGIPIAFWVMLVVFVVCTLLLKYTKFGSNVYAIGSSEKNAKLGGIKTNRYKLIVYIISGIGMGIAAFLMASRIMQVTQESGGDSYLMDALSAVIIGGTAMEGGKGDMFGTLLGVLFMGIISSLLVFLSIPTIGQQCFKGIVIILALLLNYISKRIKEKEEITNKEKILLQKAGI